MNTITEFKNPFINEFSLEAFHETIVAIRAKARNEGLTSSEHVLYNMLRDLPIDRGFGLVKNSVKLANGQGPTQGVDSAKYTLKYLLARKADSLKLSKEKAEFFLNKLK